MSFRRSDPNIYVVTANALRARRSLYFVVLVVRPRDMRQAARVQWIFPRPAAPLALRTIQVVQRHATAIAPGLTAARRVSGY